MNINKPITAMTPTECAAYRKYLIYHAGEEMTLHKRREELKRLTQTKKRRRVGDL